MNILTGVVARILFSVPFLVFGILHLMNADQMAGMVPIPGGVVWIYLTGIAMIAYAISLISTKLIRLSSLLAAVMLLGYVTMVHLPGVINAADDSAMMTSMMSLLKDTGLMGGALAFAGIYSNK